LTDHELNQAKVELVKLKTQLHT